VTLEDLEFRGVSFPKGTIVMVCAFTGNRERREGAPDPDAFDITVERDRTRPLTFGAGIHYCLGANLARAELQEALRFLAGHVAELHLDGEPVYEQITGIYGLSALPLRVVPA
jgi:cytochrome P450